MSGNVYSDNIVKSRWISTRLDEGEQGETEAGQSLFVWRARSKQHFLNVPTARKARQALLRISARLSAAMSLAQGNPVPRPGCSTPPPKVPEELPAINLSPLADFNDHAILTPPGRARGPIEPAVVGVKGKHGVAKRKRCVDHDAQGPRFLGRRLL